MQLNQQCNFPWLLSNVHKLGGIPIANCINTHTFEKQGVKFGVVGLAEEEWIATLGCFDPDDLDYEDFCNVAED